MTIPHRDDVTRSPTLGPDHHHHTIFQPSGCNLPDLAIIKSVIDKGRGPSRENRSRVDSEIDASTLQRHQPLRGVEGDRFGLM
jgi:hypothetical protein